MLDVLGEILFYQDARILNDGSFDKVLLVGTPDQQLKSFHDGLEMGLLRDRFLYGSELVVDVVVGNEWHLLFYLVVFSYNQLGAHQLHTSQMADQIINYIWTFTLKLTIHGSHELSKVKIRLGFLLVKLSMVLFCEWLKPCTTKSC